MLLVELSPIVHLTDALVVCIQEVLPHCPTLQTYMCDYWLDELLNAC